jgi:hypothetical protein
LTADYADYADLIPPKSSSAAERLLEFDGSGSDFTNTIERREYGLPLLRAKPEERAGVRRCSSRKSKSRTIERNGEQEAPHPGPLPT